MRPARGHMPFPGHRTQKEVREEQEDESREALIRKLERELLQGMPE